jgi:Acetyltransferase (GNAT) domain
VSTNEQVSGRSLAAAVEERLLVPTYGSRWRAASIAAHRSLALPLQLVGPARRRTTTFRGEQLRLLEVGREKLTSELCARLLGELPQAITGAVRALWNPSALAADADLILVEVHRWMAPRFRRAGWLMVPDAVRWEGELSQVPPAQASRSLLEDLKKIRRYGYTVEHTTAPADWDEFVSTMLRPLALVRHGNTAWVASRGLLRQLSRSGTLHFVRLDGERVAAACSVPRGETIWLPLSGIRNGDPSLLRRGASVAALAATLDWARAQGYRRVDAGRTSPFLHDGVQQFKRKWGLLPVPDPLAHLVGVWAGSQLGRAVLSRSPVLVETVDGLATHPGGVA